MKCFNDKKLKYKITTTICIFCCCFAGVHTIYRAGIGAPFSDWLYPAVVCPPVLWRYDLCYFGCALSEMCNVLRPSRVCKVLIGIALWMKFAWLNLPLASKSLNMFCNDLSLILTHVHAHTHAQCPVSFVLSLFYPLPSFSVYFRLFPSLTVSLCRTASQQVFRHYCQSAVTVEKKSSIIKQV